MLRRATAAILAATPEVAAEAVPENTADAATVGAAGHTLRTLE